jgi:glucose-1-phosphate thymidylyltransferase
MDVIILVGGYAKRLWPLTQDKPKSLLKIMGKEILSYILDNLNNFDNVGHIYVSTNREFKKHFIDFFNEHGSYSNMDIELIIEPHTKSSERLGPIGGLEYIREAKGTGDHMIIAGDNMFKFNLADFFNFHKRRNKSAIALQLPSFLRGMSQLGIVEVDSTDKVIEFDEKPAWPENKLISTGGYILTQEDFDLVSDYIKAGKDIDSLGKFMRWLALDKKRGIIGYKFFDEWFDVGTLDSLLSANRSYLKSDIFGKITGNVEIYENVYIDKGTIIRDSEIGPDVYVGKNSVIIDSKISDALIYDNVTINEGVIQHSVIDEDSSVAGSMSGIISTKKLTK